MRRGGHQADGVAPRLEFRGGPLGPVPRGGHVDLVERDDPGPVPQVGAGRGLVGGELVLDQVQVGDRIAARLLGRAVEHVHQHRAALHVPEEVEPEALAAAGPGDQPGHVGDHELGVTRLDHAQVRGQRGERVIRDLGPGGRHGGDQRRLPRVRESHQASVRDGLQLKHQAQLAPGLSAQREAWRLAPGRRERRVPEAAAAALRGHEPGPGPDQVGQHLAVAGLHHGPVGHAQHQVGALGAVAVGALRPAFPLPARRSGRRWKSSSVAALGSTSMITSPPRPPLPPSGPPSGLNFSLRIEAQPCPPSPACTCNSAWSANSATPAPRS